MDRDYLSLAEKYASSAQAKLDAAISGDQSNPDSWERIRALQAQAQLYATLAVRDQLFHITPPEDWFQK